MNKKLLFTVFFILICISAAVLSQEEQKKEEKKKDTFTFSSNTTEAVLAKGKEHTLLQGDARITTEDKDILADRIDIYGEDFEYAVCRGNVTVIDSKNDTTLTCQSLKYNRETGIIIVDGYSEMEDRGNELVAKSGYIEDRGDEDLTILQIGVRILKIADEEPMSCRSEYAGYDRKNNILELTGMPRVYWKGDTYEASRITINLDTDEIELEGNVSGSITSE